ncbi:hypothetical protein [Kribbella catacumbae]|nr:hypothetical protein [Kribbella catacumbae]
MDAVKDQTWVILDALQRQRQRTAYTRRRSSAASSTSSGRSGTPST